MRHRAALFDFDGTITPSLPLWLKAYQYALQRFEVFWPDADVIRRCFFRDWEVVAAEIGAGSAAELEEHVHAGLRTAFRDAAAFPLVPAILMQCRAHGMQVALVTSAPRAIIGDVLPRLGVAHQFDFIVCGEDVDNYKPHPEPVLKALAALGREPHEAIMIGDSRVDVLAGKAAGTATALFMPADDIFHSEQVLRATNPDYIFTDHAELPALLGLPAS